MKTVSQKSPGRPATGRDPLVPVRLPRQLLEAVERWAWQYDGMSRSSALRALIGLGLATSRQRERPVYDPKRRREPFTRKPDAFDVAFGAGGKPLKQPEPPASIPARAQPLSPDHAAAKAAAAVKAQADRIEAMAAARRAKQNQSRQG